MSDEVDDPPRTARPGTARPGGAAWPSQPQPDGARSKVSTLPARIYAARMRSRERWRRLSVTVTVALVLLSIALYMIVWHSSLFTVTTVRVAGEKTVSAQQVISVSALGKGAPLMSVDTGGAAARVQKLPQIASARVSLDWPHTVVITVTERVPAALIPSGSGYDVVDISGVAFKTVTGPVAGLTVIQVQGGPAVKAAVVPGALAALKALPPDIAHQVTGIAASSEYSIVLTLHRGVTVQWGGSDNATVKAADLVAMMRLGRATRYDVSAPETPAMS